MPDFVGPQDPDIPHFAVDLRGTLPMPAKTRSVGRITHAVMHRAGGKDWPTDTADLVEALLPHWPGTGSPYWAFIEPSGRVVVVNNLESKGAHATPNSTLLGIAVIGDFRKHAPATEQRKSLLRLSQWLMDRFEKGIPFIVGHMELDGASAHPNKVCPGPLLDMDALREDLSQGRGCL